MSKKTKSFYSNGRKPSVYADKKQKKSIVRNDFNWWNKYPGLTEEATKFAFNYIMGQKVPMTGFGGGTATSMPFITIYSTLPTIGRCVSADSPFMAQIRDVYIDMHRRYRGIGTYDVSDLGAFIFCSFNFFEELSAAERIYGLFDPMSAVNNTVPRAVLGALGIDFDSEVPNLASFRGALAKLTTQAEHLYLPKGFAAYEDAVVLRSMILKDSESPRSSFYAFDSDYYYRFNGTKYNSGSACEAVLRNKTTLAGIISDLQDQLTSIINNSSCQKMASDIIACYGENGIETHTLIPDNYKTPIQRDDTRLAQIHNMTVCGGQATLGTETDRVWGPCNILPTGLGVTPTGINLDIAQKNSVLFEDLHIVCYDSSTTPISYRTVSNADLATNPWLELNGLTASDSYSLPMTTTTATVNAIPVRLFNRILDTWKESPTTEDRMEMTRLTVPVRGRFIKVSGMGQAHADYRCEAFGTHIVYQQRTYQVRTTLSSPFFWIQNQRIAPAALSSRELFITQFDWHPITYVDTQTAPSTPAVGDEVSLTYTYVNSDLDNICVYQDRDNETLPILHYAALMSAYKPAVTGGGSSSL